MLPVGNFSLINITAGALGVPLSRLPDRQRDRPLAGRARADRVRRPDRRHRPAAAPAQPDRAGGWSPAPSGRRCGGSNAASPGGGDGRCRRPVDCVSPPTTSTSASAATAGAIRRASRPCCARSTPTSSACRRWTPAPARRASRCRCNISRPRSAITRWPARRCCGRAANTATRILTRRRVLDVRRVDLTVYRREPRGALDVDLDIDGRTVRVLVTHLGLLPGERRKQVRRLLDLLGDHRFRRRRPVRRHQRVVRGRASPALAARAPGTDRRRPDVSFRISGIRARSHLGSPARGAGDVDRAREPGGAAGVRSPAAAGRHPARSA